jgi:hypothetical protein
MGDKGGKKDKAKANRQKARKQDKEQKRKLAACGKSHPAWLERSFRQSEADGSNDHHQTLPQVMYKPMELVTVRKSPLKGPT